MVAAERYSGIKREVLLEDMEQPKMKSEPQLEPESQPQREPNPASATQRQLRPHTTRTIECSPPGHPSAVGLSSFAVRETSEAHDVIRRQRNNERARRRRRREREGRYIIEERYAENESRIEELERDVKALQRELSSNATSPPPQ